MKEAILDRVRVSKTVRAFLDTRRPPAALRTKVDFGFRYYDQSVELLEIRPRMGGRTGSTEQAFAKATYVKTLGVWKVYWIGAGFRWQAYETPTAPSLEAFLGLVHGDKHGCFFL